MHQKGFSSIALFTLVVLLLAGGAGYYVMGGQTMFTFIEKEPVSVNSYQECVDAGYPIKMTSSIPGFAIDCTAPDGIVFPNPKYGAQAENAIPLDTQVDPPSTGKLTALPTRGTRPLTVTFSYPFSQDREAPVINFGDGSESLPMSCGRSGCVLTHTYNPVNWGERVCVSCRARLITKAADGSSKVVDSVVVTVEEPDTAPLSVPGMTKYTDSQYGFSFWYPSNWSVSKSGGMDASYLGGSRAATIIVTDGKHSISISEVYSAHSITVPYNGMGEGRLLNTFYFDAGNHIWMAEPLPGSMGSLTPMPADVSNNTMGGLHMFSAAEGHGAYAFIVPLTAHNFLAVEGHHEAADESRNTDALPLLKTILATDPTVATPVSAAEQIKVIQAEKDAYVK